MLDNRELVQIFGDEGVLDNQKILETYSQDISFVSRVRFRCVVKPRNAKDLTALIKWANATAAPLIPVSSGGPHFRGDTVPSAGGAVIVNISGMKQIISIDQRNLVAMVQPE